MIKRNTILLVGLLVYSLPIHAQNNQQRIEIFHIEMGKVVKAIPTSPDIQEEAGRYISNISGVYKKLNPLPAKGYIVKIPLQPPFLVENQWIHTLADELNIIFPSDDDPVLMMYDDEHHVYFFTINSDVDPKSLEKLLGVEIEKGKSHLSWNLPFNFIVL